MDSLMIFRGFFGFDFFCLIFVIKGVPGDPSRREGGGGCSGPFRVLQTP